MVLDSYAEQLNKADVAPDPEHYLPIQLTALNVQKLSAFREAISKHLGIDKSQSLIITP